MALLLSEPLVEPLLEHCCVLLITNGATLGESNLICQLYKSTVNLLLIDPQLYLDLVFSVYRPKFDLR